MGVGRAMVRINHAKLYERSLAALYDYTGHRYFGRLVQIFLAAKYYGDQIPVAGRAVGLSTSVFQRLLDDFYEKPSRAPGRTIVSIFSNNHLPRTGGKESDASPANNWRNNVNIQKGYGCFAPKEEFAEKSFLKSSRAACPHLRPISSGHLTGATCSLVQGAAGQYRKEDHPKALRVDPGTREIFIYDPTDMEFYAPILLGPHGRKLPVGPLLVALYYDSPLAGGRQEIDIRDFATDFRFSQSELETYFTDDVTIDVHSTIASDYPGMFSWSPFANVASAASYGSLGSHSGTRTGVKKRRAAPPPGYVGAVSPPAGGHWWHAEQAVKQLLEENGWAVADHSRLGLGYDLLATNGSHKRYVEVKSSVGTCSPALTDNELAEAKKLKAEYVLAVVENFDPNGPVTVLWVTDPARLSPSPRVTTLHSIPRSRWLPNANGQIL